MQSSGRQLMAGEKKLYSRTLEIISTISNKLLAIFIRPQMGCSFIMAILNSHPNQTSIVVSTGLQAVCQTSQMENKWGRQAVRGRELCWNFTPVSEWT
ncbi:hypothetical protein AMELA_G00196840 [Ameiurus melas]|uniref:Uncharacterized protein n=1 Tax=Ameiurus melas TaxID=219545 RepID=A0A7J6A609_AMEME|nr:hypothetical protein AMELA_G00196840 [Ameiurus melas]